MSHNLDATVFVYRHTDGHIKALYKEDARAMAGKEDFEHIATLEPRMWIEYHYDDAKAEREKCANVCDDLAELNKESETDSMWQLGECAAAIRALED